MNDDVTESTPVPKPNTLKFNPKTDDDLPGRALYARETAGLSRKQAATLLNTDIMGILGIETGSGVTPSRSMLNTMAKIYGCSEDWLVFGKKNEISAGMLEQMEKLKNPSDKAKLIKLLESL